MCFDFLEIVEKLDEDYPLEYIGKRNELNWESFLEYVHPLFNYSGAIFCGFYPQINFPFSYFLYVVGLFIVKFFRKYLEVEILEIYKTLKKEFGHDIPDNHDFYKRLIIVDQFDYSRNFLNFSNGYWLKLDDIHREKQEDLDLALSKIIHFKEIEENSHKVLDI